MRSFLLIFLTTWILNLFLGWWAILLPTILFGAWFMEKGSTAFLIGSTAGGLAWFIQALHIHIANEGILSSRIAEMLQVGSPWIILLITFLIGGILGGFGSLFGYQLKKSTRQSAAHSTNKNEFN